MANVFFQLAIPTAPGVGAAVDVSTAQADKTISLPAYTGRLLLEASGDGSSYAPVAAFDGPAGDALSSSIVVACNFMRVRRLSGIDNPKNLDVAAEEGTSASFLALPLVGTPVDVSAIGRPKTLIVTGDFEGEIIIEGSADGSNFNPVQGIKIIGAGVYPISAVYQLMRVGLIIKRGGEITGVRMCAIEGGGGSGGKLYAMGTFLGQDSTSGPGPFVQGGNFPLGFLVQNYVRFNNTDPGGNLADQDSAGVRFVSPVTVDGQLAQLPGYDLTAYRYIIFLQSP